MALSRTKQCTKVPVVGHLHTNSHSPELRDCNRSAIEFMFKISTASLMRLVAVAAIGLAVVNWWPRSTAPAPDGSIAWYHGLWGPRSYYKVTGIDEFGNEFIVELDSLPGYSRMTGTFPDGSLREETTVFVAGHIDGCDVKRVDVTNGAYYSPNGIEIGRVKDGTGNIKYCQPNGNPIQEYILKNRQLAVERHWYKDGTRQSERNYVDGKLHGECSDYFPDGALRSKSTFEQNATLEAIWYDQNGNVLKKIDRE